MNRKVHPNPNRSPRGFVSPALPVSLSPCLLVFLLLGLTWARQPDSRQLLREGRLAMARGDYEGAVVLCEHAEQYSTDPTETAFYLAEAKYHLAKKTEGISAELLEAEQLFRCCLEPSDPHRPRALLGLGNCLLHKAGGSDEASLRAALACYDLCLQSAGGDEELIFDARHNREKARLLLLQFPPPPDSSSGDKPPNNDGNQQPPRPDRPQPTPLQPENGSSENGKDSGAVPSGTKPEEGNLAARSDAPPQPGKGNLPPIPDQLEVPPLSPHDASEHLRLAAQKVLHENQIHHRRGERPAASGVKDW